MKKIKSSEITPESVYLNRRQFIKAGGLLAGAFALAACGLDSKTTESLSSNIENGSIGEASPTQSGRNTDELGDSVNSFEDVTNYNNYYEFTTDKQGVARLAKDFVVRPWTVEIGGLVRKAAVYDIEDILKKFPREERVYRLRCVEGWSMVIPWLGFPLNKLLAEVEPLEEARFVRFETIYDPDQMPGQKSGWYNWPYVEGLRLDEAMNDLALISTGLYGKELLPQNGAPLRLVVPWKYGFKSIKSIVKIELVKDMPVSLWMAAAPNEYGFYANVNPEVNHPRWSQSTERRIGEIGRRKTLMFNGYEEEVSNLYAGMDLSINY
ncbi:MAG TPA: protein-methionine-sulfoxide reductase catalytic subunit MsrP [Anaerolineales bacterium]|nr:protein-methionine-sulfoxide reductase catalytic subunit MsrP [Anaerolineales bacterium]